MRAGRRGPVPAFSLLFNERVAHTSILSQGHERHWSVNAHNKEMIDK